MVTYITASPSIPYGTIRPRYTQLVAEKNLNCNKLIIRQSKMVTDIQYRKKATKSALVIGAASGIGQGIAQELHTQGINVIQADIIFPKEHQEKNKRYLDATDDKSIKVLSEYFIENSIPLDFLIITIGAIDEGLAFDYPVQNLKWMLDVNILTSHRLVQEFTALLQKSKEPKVLLTGSSAGIGAFDDTHKLMPYIVSKHGLMGYFKSLRHEFAAMNIQVSLLIPSRIKGSLSENSATMRQKSLYEESENNKGSQLSNIDLTDPEEIAKEFVEKFLKGKTYISNNPHMIIEKLKSELMDFRNELFDE